MELGDDITETVGLVLIVFETMYRSSKREGEGINNIMEV